MGAICSSHPYFYKKERAKYSVHSVHQSAAVNTTAAMDDFDHAPEIDTTASSQQSDRQVIGHYQSTASSQHPVIVDLQNILGQRNTES